ncbi:GNAT family N-acetyltransferase [Mucilaginibacter litoreus]|uniref:GNAT family N-acetyltransferase n=1 Tax=Mucilaginibacter litoreus TaxID=1048221 RepID=A0ABW3AQ29_9SPHI
MLRPEWIPSAYADNDKPIIRQATIADMDTLLQFEQGVVEAERLFTPRMKEGPAKYYDFDWLIKSPEAYLAVAELNGGLIGSGYARLVSSKPYLDHPQHAYLGFMFVVPQYRGKGVNRLIIEALKQWAVSKSITELRLEVYNENLLAIKAYEKFGFDRYLLEMRMGIVQ